MTGLTTLGEVLGNDSRFNCGHFLYLPMDDVWELETRCAVLAWSDLDGVPDLAQQSGLSYALGIAAVQDVIANAREQIASVSLAQLLEAFLFYYDHDAFITFGE
jgi:hypothetical protein